MNMTKETRYNKKTDNIFVAVKFVGEAQHCVDHMRELGQQELMFIF